MRQKKHCLYCGVYFVPDPRTHNFQKACQRPQCRRERKRQVDRSWRKRNSEWFECRRPKVRQWAKDYPAYWKRYRASHHGYTRKNRAQSRQRMRQRRQLFAKQDAIRCHPVGYLKDIQHIGQQKTFAKQDAIKLQVESILVFLMAREMFAKPNDMVRSIQGVIT